MKVTNQLRDHMVKGFQMDAEATDAEVRSLVLEKMVSGDLEQDQLTELSSDGSSSQLQGMINKSVTETLEGIFTKMGIKPQGGDGGSETGDTSPDFKTKAFSGSSTIENDGNGGENEESKITSADITKSFIAGSTSIGEFSEHSIRVKSVVEGYDDTKTQLTYADSENPLVRKAYGSRPVMVGEGVGQRSLDKPTDRQNAIAGAWMKHLVNKSANASGRQIPAQFRKTEHDHQLIEYAIHECKFLGPAGWNESNETAQYWHENKKANEYQRKALADDTISGGLEAVPVELDNQTIITPLLNGELFPLATVRNVTARRIEGYGLANPTMQWGFGDLQTQPIFDTRDFIQAFDVNIHTLSGAMEIGRDFESDAPADIGGAVVNRYGEVHKQELDNVIANGNGINQPEGLFQAPGLVVVSNQAGPGLGPQVGDYETLKFAVRKEFRDESKNRCIYLSTDQSYRRARGIRVNDTNDERRIFGVENQMDYKLFGYNYKVNESFASSNIGFFCMNRYRMYRRQGVEVVIEDGGKDLRSRNKRYIVIRSRWGGALDHAGAGAKNTDAQN